MTDVVKPKRGGKRAGAGRKATGPNGERMVEVRTSIAESEFAHLMTFGADEREAIRALLALAGTQTQKGPDPSQ